MAFFSDETVTVGQKAEAPGKVFELYAIDAHSHAYEYPTEELETFVSEGVALICVSEDVETSLFSLRLSEAYHWVAPCVGVHPWEAHNVGVTHVAQLERLVSQRDEVVCIGEVGLDRRFFAETFDKQKEVFGVMLRIAKDYSLPVNLHAAGAWREVFDMVLRYDVDGGVFHWYTGPQDLLEELVDAGFAVSINPAVRMQERHKAVAEAVPLGSMLVESDGPYEYRGMKLSSLMVKETISFLAEVKGVKEAYLRELLLGNTLRVFPRAARRIVR